MDDSINAVLKRLKIVRKNRTQEEFATNLGMKRAAYARLENSGTFLSIDMLKKIAKKESVNLNWLLTGKGNPYTIPESLRSQTADKIEEPKSEYVDSVARIASVPQNKRPFTTRKTGIPIVGHVTAGEPTAIYSDIQDAMEVDYVIDEFFYHRLKYNIKNPVVFVMVLGDSMLPDFHEGDHLLIERNVPYDMIKKNAYGIFADENGEFTFKRYNPKKNIILLEPLNSKYNTIAVRPEDIKIFGVTIALFRPLR